MITSENVPCCGLRPGPRRLPAMLLLAVLLGGAVAAAAPEKISVVIWDEQQPAQKKVYPRFLGAFLAEALGRRDDFAVTSVALADPDQGLAAKTLEGCDVLVWWGHVRQHEVSEARCRVVVDLVKQGRLSLIVLHSAHFATPFMMAMEDRAMEDARAALPPDKRRTAQVTLTGARVRRAPRRSEPLTPAATTTTDADGTVKVAVTRPNCCFPAYRANGKPSTTTTLLPKHPIARGIPATFTLPQTEMYDEPFHVPVPDAVIFEERWETGHRFRSGAVWNLGKGKVFYFRPGHESYTVFLQKEPVTILENACRWLGREIRRHKPEKQAAVGRPVRVVSLCHRPSDLDTVATVVDAEGAKGADLICLPETWRGQGMPETLEGPTVTAMAALAKKHRTYIVCPLDRRDGKCRLNSSILIDRSGNVVCVYNKAYPYWSEFGLKPPVDVVKKEVPVYRTDFGTIGFAICFDANFPDVWAALADRGAELVVWSSAYSAGRQLQAHALNHHYYIVTATYTGDCQVYDITGERILDERGPGIHVSRTVLDLDRGLYHQNFNISRRDKLLKERRAAVAQERFLDREQWFILKARQPGVRARDLARQYGLEELRAYKKRSREAINGMRERS